jgi:predicted glutamine amidotransferase
MFLQRSSHALSAACDLLDTPHSLRFQSRCDLVGRNHVDGWGVAVFRNRQCHLQHGIGAAHEDEAFSLACQPAIATTVLAHIRRASKGVRSLENCHPFRRGRWVFAHNGTLTAVEALRDRMLGELAASGRRAIIGDTDSELVFQWLLRRLEQRHAIDGDRCRSLAKMRAVIAEGLCDLDQRNAAAEKGSTKKDPVARLNILLTNGSVTVATRMRNTLFELHRTNQSNKSKSTRSIVIASEPMTEESWQEIPDMSVLSISSGLEVIRESMEAEI